MTIIINKIYEKRGETPMNVLIVDDELFIREGLKNNIDWMSHGIFFTDTARSGEHALEKIRDTFFDLVITDIKMHKMSGLELAETLLSVSPETKVILLSGFAEFEYAQKAIKLNVLAYLLKPVNLDEMDELINKVVKEKGNQSQNVLLEKAKSYIRNNYKKQIFLQDVANYLERNPDYFSSIFKKETGSSFSEYLNSLRIKKAQYLLTTTSMYTYEIAEKVGYTDFRYFTKIFKKITGTTPSDYRKQNSI